MTQNGTILEITAELSKGWVQFVPTLKVETNGGLQKMGCSARR